MALSSDQKVLSPRESGTFIVRVAQDVSIDMEGIKKCASEIFENVRSGKLSARNFTQSTLHPKSTDPKAVDWIFLVDTLNFSFWSGDEDRDVPKWTVQFKGNSYTGYFALCAAVNRAIEEEGLDLTDPKVYGSLTVDDILRIFRSETSTPIPMPEDRVINLQEASRILQEKYQGSFVNCIHLAQKSAQQLLNTLVSDFSSYRDQAVLDSVTVSIHKRAQILIGDIWACHEGQGLGEFDDIDSLTMFADYRIPQVLLHYGAMKYSKELMDDLLKDKLLENGERREVEIRGGSIHAVELISIDVRERLVKVGLPPNMINSILIDHFLWDYRREHAAEMEMYPYHKTRCIYY
ncbi:queuosine salvage protein [Folsomia candida]|uniref:queuosine salvage protein n=1 Tax=Folsomia candida TaxID=158441 RepID=UPI000B909636|nr:queuosine salvage protein [Folsomia candida]XP_021943216.1 queuosine salvage protein [Folsomia candida]